MPKTTGIIVLVALSLMVQGCACRQSGSPPASLNEAKEATIEPSEMISTEEIAQSLQDFVHLVLIGNNNIAITLGNEILAQATDKQLLDASRMLKPRTNPFVIPKSNDAAVNRMREEMLRRIDMALKQEENRK